jgi:hypothetical protein
MYDSVTASNIPRNAQMVAGYVDGKYKWSQSDWALFPNAAHVPIAVFASTNDGVVGDCENGDMTPAGAVTWTEMRRNAGIQPSIYCSQGLWSVVRNTFQSMGVREPLYWIAAYPGNGPDTIPAGAVAHQYADAGPYDLSTVADYWPGVDTETDMYAYYRKASTGDTAVLMPNCDFIGSPVPAGVTPIDVDDATWADYVGRFAKNAAVQAAANAAAGLTLHVTTS